MPLNKKIIFMESLNKRNLHVGKVLVTAVTVRLKECNELSQTLTKFPQDKLTQQSQMANRKALISGLYGGERFGISTLDKIPLGRLWEKLRHNEGKMPGLVKQIWVTYLDKNSQHGQL